MREFTPSLHVAEASDGVHLTLQGITHASGPTLQDAGDELVCKVLSIAIAVRSGSLPPATAAARVDPETWDFIWELGVIAAGGGDIRDRLFGSP